MDVVIITGASSALGQAISRQLLGQGFRVYGLGGDYSNCDLKNIDFIPFPCDLSDPKAVDQAAREILKKERAVYAIVHNAKFYPRGRFAETFGEILERSLKINLLSPLILTQVLADSLCKLQGHVVQIGPANMELSQGGVIGATAAAGLKAMGEAIFEELRDNGVRVCYLSPEPNVKRSQAGRREPDPQKEASIDSRMVANAVAQIISNSDGNIITEMVIRPVRTEARSMDAVKTLPYPPPQPIPYTVPREIIEAEEQLEEEEFQKSQKPQKSQAKKKSRSKKKEPNKKPEEVAVDEKKEDSSSADSEKESPKVSKKRRPRKKSDNKTQEEVSEASVESTDQNDRGKSKNSDTNRRKGRKPRPASHAPANTETQASQESGNNYDTESSGFSSGNRSKAPNQRNKMAERRAIRKARIANQNQADSSVKAKKKTPKKAAKKVAKKAVKKVAKKNPTKKVAKKSTGNKAVKKVARKQTKAKG